MLTLSHGLVLHLVRRYCGVDKEETWDLGVTVYTMEHLTFKPY